MVDQRTSLRREGRLSQKEGRRLGRKIRAAVKADRRERARRAGEKLMEHLGKGEVREAFGTIWGWHKSVEPKAAKPCWRTMEEQTRGREDLYKDQPPPGEPIPRNAERASSEDAPPADEELRRATKRSGNGKSGGASAMRAEDLKEWLWGVEEGERG